MPASARPPTSLVQAVRIASPCPLAEGAWGANERERFCPSCQLHVHNLSARTTAEADTFLRAHTGSRLCARYEQDFRGRPITRDRRLARLTIRAASMASRFGRLAGRAAAVLGLAGFLGTLGSCTMGGRVRPRDAAPPPDNTPASLGGAVRLAWLVAAIGLLSGCWPMRTGGVVMPPAERAGAEPPPEPVKGLPDRAYP